MRLLARHIFGARHATRTKSLYSQSCPAHLTATTLYGFDKHAFSSASAESAGSLVKRQLKSFVKTMACDPYSKMLSSPLRRCSVTHAVAPTALMFKVIVERREGSARAPNIAAAGLVDRLRSEISEMRRRNKGTRRPRYLRREAARSVEAAIERSVPALKHKVVTSITAESRAKFQRQLDHTTALLEVLRRPAKQGVISIGGILRHDKGKRVLDDDITTQSQRYKRAIWCTLQFDIAKELRSKGLDRRMLTDDDVPADICDQIKHQLIERVKQELDLLLRRVQTLERKSASKIGWIISRVKDVRLLQQYLAGANQPDGKLALVNDTMKDVGAWLLFSSSNSEDAPGLESAGLSRLPGTMFDCGSLLRDEESETQVRDATGDIARWMSKRVSAGLRALAKERSGDRQARVDISPDLDSDIERSWNSLQPFRLPRLYKIKRHGLTTDLCIALWRLQVWCESEPTQVRGRAQ